MVIRKKATKAKKPVRTKGAAKTTAPRSVPTKPGGPMTSSAGNAAPPVAKAKGAAGVRVRMYRVGFGDFFLMSVTGKSGPAHILIDCGVHAANINSIGDCVQDMKKETNSQLALVILTHYHADHMSGFASNYNDFTGFNVGAVWITNRLDPAHKTNAKFMAQLTSVAAQLRLQLGARTDEAGTQAAAKVENALGANGGGNAKALKLLQSGFKNKPPVYYYQGGDSPVLPSELQGMITAEILAPAPIDSGGTFSATDNKKEQYLAAVADAGVPGNESIRPFEKYWPATKDDYPECAFAEFESRTAMEKTLHDVQPDTLAAVADSLDGTLNNQSLVVLFTVAGKKLLFVGDAQWGNWAYWLYGKAVAGADPGISANAKTILGSIDFYKVGHHGSTNATPIPAVGALSGACAAMCSTAKGAYGNPVKNTEVPRSKLVDALETRTGNRLVRSDWVAVDGKAKPEPDAVNAVPKLPAGFSSPGQLYIDFNL